MKLVDEFKAFISRGSAIDMAVGIIIGASFTKSVNILVANILMPPIGLLLGGVDFSDLKVTLKEATKQNPAVTIDYGLFINTLIDFLIIAFSVFILIKILGKFKRKIHSVPDKKKCSECQMEVPVKAVRCPYCTSPCK